MKALGYVLGACLVLAVAQAVAAALMIGVVLAIVIGALTRPRETLALMGLLGIAGVFRSYPLACLGTIALICIASILLRYSKVGD